MVVTSPKKQVDINIQNIERKDHIKYLGVFIDKHLRVAKNIVFTHKILNKKKDIPAIFSDFIIPTVDIHSHKTWYATQGNLYRTNTRTDYLTTWNFHNIFISRFCINFIFWFTLISHFWVQQFTFHRQCYLTCPWIKWNDFIKGTITSKLRNMQEHQWQQSSSHNVHKQSMLVRELLSLSQLATRSIYIENSSEKKKKCEFVNVSVVINSFFLADYGHNVR